MSRETQRDATEYKARLQVVELVKLKERLDRINALRAEIGEDPITETLAAKLGIERINAGIEILKSHIFNRNINRSA